VPVNHNLLAFDRRASESLGILPQLPINLGGQIFHIGVMIVQGPLDFDLLFGCDYVYAMKAIMSTLFRVMYFLYNGNIVTIDQLLFIKTDHHMISDHPISLNVPYIVVSPQPQVHYVATSPLHSTPNEYEPLTVCSTSFDLDLVAYMVICSIGILESDLPTPIATLNMYSFWSIVLSFNEDLLEAMIKVCPLKCIPSIALPSWKP
jgi:hypothetical protein